MKSRKEKVTDTSVTAAVNQKVENDSFSISLSPMLELFLNEGIKSRSRSSRSAKTAARRCSCRSRSSTRRARRRPPARTPPGPRSGSSRWSSRRTAGRSICGDRSPGRQASGEGELCQCDPSVLLDLVAGAKPTAVRSALFQDPCEVSCCSTGQSLTHITLLTATRSSPPH